VLNLNVDMFAGFHGIVVYHGEILAHREVMDEDGIVHEYDEVIAGEAMPGGPVVLSWEDVSMSQDHAAPGYNVVIHEFAHKLDMLDGDADGVPPFDARFHAGLTRKLWNEVATPAYEAFCRDVDVWERRGEPDDAWPALDPYAAEHPAEFFAVSAEVLFTDPLALQMRFPEWHALLKRYFRTS
jgi:MtfA peptidase